MAQYMQGVSTLPGFEAGQSGMASPVTLSPRGIPASEAAGTQSAHLRGLCLFREFRRVLLNDP